MKPKILKDIELPSFTRAFMNTGAILPTSTVHIKKHSLKELQKSVNIKAVPCPD